MRSVGFLFFWGFEKFIARIEILDDNWMVGIARIVVVL